MCADEQSARCLEFEKQIAISTAVTEDTHSTAVRGIAFDFSLKSATRGRDLPFFEVLHEANLDPARGHRHLFYSERGSLYPRMGDLPG